jgi:radical SAM superfamily enzyme YgiQ (UPF0313 family)
MKKIEVLFIQNLFAEYMGVMYLSAILKQEGVPTDIIIENKIENIVNYIETFKPKIIAFSVITGLHKFPLAVGKIIKEKFPYIKIIAGGPHPTFFQDYIKNNEIDAICIGEGENTIVKYYNYIIGNEKIENVPNLIFKKDNQIYKNPISPLIEDLDKLPFPDRIYDKYKTFQYNTTKNVLATRGCPYNCFFCYNWQYKKLYENKGKCVRSRTPQNIIDEILYLKERYKKNLKIINFSGDVFFYNKNWVINFLNLYIEKVRLPFITNITANLIDNEIGKLLKKAKCIRLHFAIEAGNENIRKKILNKNISNEDIINCANILKENRIPFRTYNMVGLPTETIDNMFETIELNVKIRTYYPWCSIFTPYPGTELANIAIKTGELDSKFSIDDIPSSFMERSVLKRNDVNEIENLQKLFIILVKFPFLIKFAKKIIKIKPNIIFNLIFGLTYAISIAFADKYNLKFVIKNILNNWKFFVKKKK